MYYIATEELKKYLLNILKQENKFNQQEVIIKYIHYMKTDIIIYNIAKLMIDRQEHKELRGFIINNLDNEVIVRNKQLCDMLNDVCIFIIIKLSMNILMA